VGKKTRSAAGIRFLPLISWNWKRPVNEKRFANHVLFWNEAKIAAIPADVAVVTHGKVPAFDPAWQVAEQSYVQNGEIVVPESLKIQKQDYQNQSGGYRRTDLDVSSFSFLFRRF